MSKAGPLADTHCHLVLPEFDQDLSGVLDRARQAGVEWFLVPGIDVASSRLSVKLAEEHEDVFAAVGLHPHGAKAWGPAVKKELHVLAQSDRVVAIGEIGLDYYRDQSPRNAQREAFRAQLDLAVELGLPVVVHNRQATGDVLQDLLEWSGQLAAPLEERAGVLHAFSADIESASKAIAAGFYVGIAGPVTYPKAFELRRMTTMLPLDRLVIETDAPYLPPQAHRGKRNEPAYTRLVAEELSSILDTPYSSIARATTANASTLFGWKHGNHHGQLP